MLSIARSPKYLERLLILPTGKVVLVTFELIEREGKTIAKAVSITEVAPKTGEKILCLPCTQSPIEFAPVKSIFFSTVNDLVRDLSFIMSQPTRAPSF